MPEKVGTRRDLLDAYETALWALVEEHTQRVGRAPESLDERRSAIHAVDDEPESPLDDPVERVAAEDGVSLAQAEAEVDEEAQQAADELLEWSGVPVVTRKDLDEALRAVFGQPLPPASETEAEVRTPAYVLVSAVCPRCHIAQDISVEINPELLISNDGSELRLKAKAKGRTHLCGQLPLATNGHDAQVTLDELAPVADEPGEGVEDVAREAMEQTVAAVNAGALGPDVSASVGHGPTPVVGDPVVVDGTKLRIKSLDETYAYARASFGDRSLVSVELASLHWDDQAGVWREGAPA